MTDHKLYQNTQELAVWTVLVAKSDSAFVYFTLEASDHSCFYSTTGLDALHNQCILEIQAPIEWEKNVDSILGSLTTRCDLKVSDKKILVSKPLMGKL